MRTPDLGRPASWLRALVAVGALAGSLAAVGCGGASSAPAASNAAARAASTGAPSASTPTPPPPPPPPALVVRAPRHGPTWRAFAVVHGHDAAWLKESGETTLMRFDQRYVHLDLHSGTIDGGESGSVYGNRITSHEVHKLVAAFNGGFKLTYSNVGFLSGGHVAVPLQTGLGSLVTYTDGTSNIGAWHEGVPASGSRVFSVLQNQRLLVDHGRSNADESCVLSCWGDTIGGQSQVARSAVGVTADGQIVWAAGEQLTPVALARTLIEAGVVRAIELDINPFWVAGYAYRHTHSGPLAVPAMTAQHGIEGQLLTPNQRDFFAVVAN